MSYTCVADMCDKHVSHIYTTCLKSQHVAHMCCYMCGTYILQHMCHTYMYLHMYYIKKSSHMWHISRNICCVHVPHICHAHKVCINYVTSHGMPLVCHICGTKCVTLVYNHINRKAFAGAAHKPRYIYVLHVWSSHVAYTSHMCHMFHTYVSHVSKHMCITYVTQHMWHTCYLKNIWHILCGLTCVTYIWAHTCVAHMKWHMCITHVDLRVW